MNLCDYQNVPACQGKNGFCGRPAVRTCRIDPAGNLVLYFCGVCLGEIAVLAVALEAIEDEQRKYREQWQQEQREDWL